MRPARDFPPKFERYNTWFTGEGVSLAFGDREVTHVPGGGGLPYETDGDARRLA